MASKKKIGAVKIVSNAYSIDMAFALELKLTFKK